VPTPILASKSPFLPLDLKSISANYSPLNKIGFLLERPWLTYSILNKRGWWGRREGRQDTILIKVRRRLATAGLIIEHFDELLPGKGYNKGVHCREKLLTHIGNAYG
jgi:hypothetical protein